MSGNDRNENETFECKSPQSYAKQLEKYHFSQQDKDVLTGFFAYLLQTKITDVAQRILVQSETREQSEEFFEDLKRIVSEILSYKKQFPVQVNSAIVKEADILGITKDDTNYSTLSLLGIMSALPDHDFYIQDYDSSSDKSIKNKLPNRWRTFIRYANKKNDMIVVMFAPKDIAEGRIKNSPYLWDFFNNYISIGEMGEGLIFDSLMEVFNEKVGRYTIDFRYKLKEYIHATYPLSEVKNKEYIDSVSSRMISLSFQKMGHCDYLSELSIPPYQQEQQYDNVESEINRMVGLEGVKASLRDIGILCQSIKDKDNMPYLHMVFKGNPGTGKTTVANLLAGILYSMGVIKRNIVVPVMSADLIGVYMGQTGPKVENALEKASDGVLVIDEAYLLNPDTGGSYKDTYREECIGTLIKAMENKTNPIVIFAGYPKEMDELIKSNPGLKSRIGYTLNFEDYSDDQLLDIFRRMCEKAGYQYDQETLEAVRRKIVALKYEENFGNARTVENLFNHAVIMSLRSETEDKKIKAEHILIEKDTKTTEDLQRQLDSKIGLMNAKKIIFEQIMVNKFCRETGKKLPSSNNMIFVGNAGTGKTTIAKLFAEMLFSIGVAKSPKTKMISAKDLFVQNAGTRLNEICAEAMGGVLFIDEIYLLNSSYLLNEIVSVLLEVLESRKEDITFILAGYEKQMNEFLNENQGMKSRFPITVHFDDFTEDELCDIFRLNCKEGGIRVSDETMKRFKSIIREEMKKENFGNGRTVRNIFEQAFRRHAANYYQTENRDPDLLLPDDIEDPSEVGGGKSKIGF